MKNKKKSIYIHVPKCGGMSMEHICQSNDINIDPINRSPEWIKARKRYKNIENEKFDYSFTFLRNPFSRIVSAWKCRWVNSGEFKNFNLFVDKFLLHSF